MDAQVGRCNGDEAVRRAVEAAVYKASPLPEPDNPAIFQRDLRITFKPEQ
jgi:colicin import membrane protein